MLTGRKGLCPNPACVGSCLQAHGHRSHVCVCVRTCVPAQPLLALSLPECDFILKMEIQMAKRENKIKTKTP